MTKKLAIFVEGQTEQIFIERMVSEIASKSDIHLEKKSLSGNGLISLDSIASGDRKYHVLLFNCENDEKVKSVVLDQRQRMVSHGYSMILGLRDLYPTDIAKLAAVKSRLQYGLPTSLPITEMHLAVTETESWFLQETTHFSKIDSALDHRNFKNAFGFDPAVDSAELVPHPSELLKDIYRSVGMTYRKTRHHVQRTVDSLDFAELCFSCSGRIPHFHKLATRVMGFFS